MSDWSSTLYNGYNGLLSSGNTLSVIGNNIANANTTGYKAATSTFEDLFASVEDGQQIGNGGQLADIRTLQTQGASQTTTTSTNLAIGGNGLFMVRQQGDQEVTAYTRDGNFKTAPSTPADPRYAPDTLKLVNSQGFAVQGQNLASTVPPTPATICEDIMIRSTSPAKATSEIKLSLNLEHNPAKVETSDTPLYQQWDGTKVDRKGNSTPIGAKDYDYKEAVQIYDANGTPQNLTIYFDHTDNPNQQEFLVTCAPNQDHRLIGNSGSRYNSGPTTTDKGAGALLYGTIQFDTNGELVDIASYNVPADGNVDHTTATNRVQLGRGEGCDKFSYNFSGAASADMVTTLQFGNISQPQAAISTAAAYATATPGAALITGQTVWNTVYDGTGKQVAAGDTLTFTGTKGDGTAVSYNYTVDPTRPVGDLLTNLSLQFGATATLDQGALHLADQTPGDSQLGISTIGYTDKNGGTPATNANLAQIIGPQGTPFTTTSWNRFARGLLPTTNYAKPSVTLTKTQDGLAPGRLESTSVSKDGVITGHYSNGDTIAQARVMLANFMTMAGPGVVGGNNSWDMSENGARTIAAPGSSGMGEVMGNTLEESNVDIAKEFTNLILTQRAFQANAKSISTADAIFDKIMAMKS